MADTPRTKAALATLFADNVAGDISPQDLRDFLESMSLPFGEMYVSTPSATTITGASFQKLNGTTTLGQANLFDMPASNRLRYTGSVPMKFLVAAAFQCEDTSGDPKQLRLFVYDDSGAAGATVASSAFNHDTVNALDNPSGTVQAIVTLDTNDYVEVHAAAPGFGGTDITLFSMNLVARALFG